MATALKKKTKKVAEPRIQVLEPEVASQIAAGEVVERPASVLKELLDNALDAGAGKIEIEVLGAGREAIRVVDDGGGMTAEEIRLAFERHATSKLRVLGDLETLETMGFRGEALNAIASVSETTITSTRDGKGWRVQSDGSTVSRESEAAPVQGTTVEVRNLFHNTPARLKFMKTEAVERGRLTRVVEEIALARPGLSLAYRLEGRLAMKLAPTDGDHALETRVGEVLGLELLEDLVPVEMDRPEAKLRGLVSRPDALVNTRNMQFFYVNGRPVQTKILQQALYKAYEDRGNKHPVCVLFLDVDPAAVDVNVHPQKLEVRFKEEGRMWEIVSAAMGRTLTLARQAAPLLAEPKAEETPAQPKSARELMGLPAPKIEPLKYGVLENPLLPESQEATTVAEPAPAYSAEQPPLGLSGERTGEDPAWWTPPFRYLGQIEQSYLLFDAAGGLLIMDQHAAAERIRYERYVKKAKEGRPPVQRLLTPIQVELPLSQFLVLNGMKDALGRAGFELEAFGEKTLLVQAVPEAFPLDDAGVRETIVRLSESQDPSGAALETLHETIATIACKASIKAHDRVSPPEAMKLLELLKNCEAPLCPHGRPALLSMDRGELARRFKRPGPPPVS